MGGFSYKLNDIEDKYIVSVKKKFQAPIPNQLQACPIEGAFHYLIRNRKRYMSHVDGILLDWNISKIRLKNEVFPPFQPVITIKGEFLTLKIGKGDKMTANVVEVRYPFVIASYHDNFIVKIDATSHKEVTASPGDQVEFVYVSYELENDLPAIYGTEPVFSKISEPARVTDDNESQNNSQDNQSGTGNDIDQNVSGKKTYRGKRKRDLSVDNASAKKKSVQIEAETETNNESNRRQESHEQEHSSNRINLLRLRPIVDLTNQSSNQRNSRPESIEITEMRPEVKDMDLAQIPNDDEGKASDDNESEVGDNNRIEEPVPDNDNLEMTETIGNIIEEDCKPEDNELELGVTEATENGPENRRSRRLSKENGDLMCVVECNSSDLAMGFKSEPTTPQPSQSTQATQSSVNTQITQSPNSSQSTQSVTLTQASNSCELPGLSQSSQLTELFSSHLRSRQTSTPLCSPKRNRLPEKQTQSQRNDAQKKDKDELPHGWERRIIWRSKDGRNRKFVYISPEGRQFSNRQKMKEHLEKSSRLVDLPPGWSRVAKKSINGNIRYTYRSPMGDTFEKLTDIWKYHNAMVQAMNDTTIDEEVNMVKIPKASDFQQGLEKVINRGNPKRKDFVEALKTILSKSNKNNAKENGEAIHIDDESKEGHIIVLSDEEDEKEKADSVAGDDCEIDDSIVQIGTQVKEDMQEEVSQLPQIARVETIWRRSIEN